MSGFAVTDYNPPAVGVLSARLGSLQSTDIAVNKDITLGVNSDRYQTFLTPSQNIDQFALNDLNTINFKKDQITDLGDGPTFFANPDTFATGIAATQAVATIYGDVITTVGVATFLTFGASQTFTVGSNIAQQNTGAFGSIFVSNTGTSVLLTGVGGTGSFNTLDSCSVGIGTTQFDPTDTVIGAPSVVSLSGFGNVHNDTITLTTYPNLEPINVNVNNPFDGKTTDTLGAGNTGLGIANTFFPNGGSFIGTVFTFDTTGDPGAATSITNISNEITGTLRTGVVSFTDTVNTIKPYKVDFAINVWSLERSKLENNLAMAGLSTAIIILNDPQFGGPY